jgi:glycosyltransferase involved in cell wall biosynthesis
MRIGFVTGEYPPMEGGVGAFTRELALAMSDAGHEIHIITSRQARPSHDDRRWWRLREPIQVDNVYLHPRIRQWWWPSMSAIADIAIEQNLDLINIQYQAAAFDMRLPAINFLPWRLRGVCKTAVTFHDLRTPYLFPKAGRLRQWVVHKLAHLADGVIATNQADQRSLLNAGLPLAKICRIPIGSNIATHQVNTAEISAIRQKLALSDEDRLLGYFGFLNESKGADALLQALAKLDKRFHLIFIGGQTGSSDPENNAAFLTGIGQMAVELGLKERVHWSGFLPDKEVSAYLQTAELMVMPYKDGVSLRRGTLMAALAHARPIVTTEPAVPILELTHGENIWFVPVDDTIALVSAIIHLTDNRTIARRLGVGAGAAAELFSWDKIAAQTAGCFERLSK